MLFCFVLYFWVKIEGSLTEHHCMKNGLTWELLFLLDLEDSLLGRRSSVTQLSSTWCFFFFYQNVFNSKRLKCSYRNRDLALEDNQASNEYEVGYTFLFILVFCFGNHFRNIVGKYAKNCLQCLNTFLSSEIF